MVVQKPGGGFTQPMMKAGVVPKLEGLASALLKQANQLQYITASLSSMNTINSGRSSATLNSSLTKSGPFPR
ncbi:hypothetical protein Vadar_017902 [Vaccinium darrowii]|uniref:Uncharacterized protein n=1 Tax=Vaccinium darrowii TaxID=229202 RepID=A0ACB7Z504_9ERIC|nr:hypothetical protein Vadar_017902 [Vaccinium darrowii]